MVSRVFLLGLILLAATAQAQNFDFALVDLKTKQEVAFAQLTKTIDFSKPTILITWSGNWCFPCIRLIQRYDACDPKMINVIAVNVDQETDRESVLAKGYHLEWKNVRNFHANLGEGKKGLDNIFNVESAPLVLIIEKGNITHALINYSAHPYLLVKSNLADVSLIWRSSDDLNSLAWDVYLNDSDPAKLKEALRWIKQSLALNTNYHNTDTYAALLFKTGDYTQALKKAREAIEIAKKNDEDYTSTTELIQKIIEKL